MDLFEHAARKQNPSAPLAELLRPTELTGLLGQDEILGEGTVLRRAIEADRIPSMILWGPPGCGKTTLAHIVAQRTGADFVSFSAVLGGVKDVRAVVAQARERKALYAKRTILFVDEIHRFNKAQQDAFLPHIEDGTITLIGATTENPAFEMNAALLSRCQVFVLQALGEQAMGALLRRALGHPALVDRGAVPELQDDGLRMLVRAAAGDARRALNGLQAALEFARDRGVGRIDAELAAQALQHQGPRYDRDGDEHYALVSAFIKSMRGSDPDAAVYYLVRMLEGGEPPRFLCRRMVIFASEDVGLADPEALRIAMAAQQAFELMGLPEGVLPLTHAAMYLACAPKSNSVLKAYAAARKEVRTSGALPVPAKLRNSTTGLARAMGHGRAYRYPHDLDGSYSPEHYLPDALMGRRFVELGASGAEETLRRRLEELRSLRDRR